MDSLDSFYKIKNGYTNQTERASFSIEVHKCNIDHDGPLCKSDTEINEILEMLVFTMYNVEEKADLGSRKNIGARPTMIKDLI